MALMKLLPAYANGDCSSIYKFKHPFPSCTNGVILISIFPLAKAVFSHFLEENYARSQVHRE